MSRDVVNPRHIALFSRCKPAVLVQLHPSRQRPMPAIKLYVLNGLFNVHITTHDDNRTCVPILRRNILSYTVYYLYVELKV